MSVQMAARFDFFFSKVKFGTPQVGSPRIALKKIPKKKFWMVGVASSAYVFKKKFWKKF